MVDALPGPEIQLQTEAIYAARTAEYITVHCAHKPEGMHSGVRSNLIQTVPFFSYKRQSSWPSNYWMHIVIFLLIIIKQSRKQIKPI